MTEETELTIRLALFAGLSALLLAIPNERSGSRIRNALGVFVLVAGFLIFCALLAETLLNWTLYAIPASAVAVIALLWWVIEPKITVRLRPLLPDRRTVQASLAWAVRGLGSYGALVVYLFVMFQVPVALFAATTLGGGLLFLSGILTSLRRLPPPADRKERMRRWGGFTLVVLGMAMIFGGSFGVSLLFNFPDEIEPRRVIIMWILFGPVYSLGWPICLLGLWLLGLFRRRD